MGGLAALFFIGLYVSVAYWTFKRFERSGFRWLVLALAVLIPSGDAVVGRLYLKHLCAEEGGLKVYRVVEHVDGFTDANFTNGDGYWVREHGYQFLEYAPVNWLVTRYSKKDGQIIRQEKVVPQSHYRVRSVHMGREEPYSRSIDLVETVDGKEVLATYTAIAFKGGWAERLVAQFSDAGAGNVAFCASSPPDKNWQNYVSLIVGTLKP